MSSKTKTTATKGEAKPALMPKLRFPEFQGGGEWAVRNLGSFASLSSGGTPAKDNPKYWHGSIPWVSASSMYDVAVEKADHYVTPLAIGNGTRIAKKGSILILVRGSMLFKRVPICVAGVDVAFNQDVKALDVEASVDTGFLLYQLLASQSRFTINETGIGAGKIELDHLKGFELFFPGKLEQQKIAECLSSLDELMASQARKVDALKTHKKGLMQQLFPREGETQPRLRFPEFRNGGEWEPKTLIDACRMQAGKFVAAADIKEHYAGHLFPCYGGNGLRGFTTTHTHDGVYPLIGRQGALCGNVKLTSERFHATEHAVVATPNLGVDAIWLYYLLDLLNLNRFATGQAQPGLSVDVLEKVPVKIPNEEREQQRIASCLSSLDALVTAETQKLEALKTHKKGLMQQLFPSPEEEVG